MTRFHEVIMCKLNTLSKIEVPRDVPRLKRSVDMTSSGKNGLNIRTIASPKWDRTRCPEE